MTYKFNTGTGSLVFLQNQGTQTFITLVSSSGSQQQSSSTSLTTGIWSSVPLAFLTGAGIVLELTTAEGKHFVNIQGNSISTLSQKPALDEAKVLTLEEESMPKMQPMEPMEPMQPMQPMEPMQPLKMGEMEMRMGSMQMNMGKDVSSLGGKNFCPQCGSAVLPVDRFCSNCGHKLYQL